MTAISGMTGFGRAEGAEGGWSWAVEARSVNGRNLEVRFRGPPGFDRLEPLAKASAQKRFGRGQVTVGVQAKRTDPGAAALKVNDDILARYLALANRLAEEGATPPSADGLLALRGVLETPEEDETPAARAAVEAAMAASIDAALDALKTSRDREGAQLLPVVTGFIDAIERLVAHLDSARQLLRQPPAGRKLDFLMQEFMREANTLCSKSATTALTGIGLALKAVIEQLREQVQNVE